MTTSTTRVLDVPVLETKRLILRCHRKEDFPESADMWADPKVTRYIRERPFTPEETWTRLLRFIGHWILLGFGYWAVEHKETRRFLGEVGFADYKRDLKPSLDGIPEIGWAFASHAHGQGFATEAVGAITAWGDSQFESRRTACIIAPENAVSVRVAMKWGYREFQHTTYNERAVGIYIRDRSSKSDTCI